jgi:hypothetical protein
MKEIKNYIIHCHLFPIVIAILVSLWFYIIINLLFSFNTRFDNLDKWYININNSIQTIDDKVTEIDDQLKHFKE